MQWPGTKHYVLVSYVIGQLSILSFLYPSPNHHHTVHIQLLDLFVLFIVTVGIVYEWFKVLPRLSIKQAVLFMVSIVTQVVELFALAYYLLFCLDVGSFTVPGFDKMTWEPVRHGYEFLYYSITTFTGTGYGDVTPATPMAKAFTSLEMLAGWTISTLMMALLGSKVSQFFFHRQSDRDR